MSEIRRVMMRSGKTRKEYVSVYQRMYPSSGLIAGRDSFFLYLTENVQVGTNIHLALTFTSIDSSVSSLAVKASAASVAEITIPMPAEFVDVEFVVSKSNTNILWCYFDKSVTNVQINTDKTKVEKIV